MSACPSRRRLLAAGTTLALLPGGAAAQATSGAGRSPLTLAVTDSPHALPVLLADKMGFFAAEGLPLRVLHFPVGRIGLERLLAGEVQFATVADAPIMFASLKRNDFSIIATVTRSIGDNSMVVRNDRGIQKPGDLRGKRIGTPRASGGHFFVDTYLLYYGLTTADITLVLMEPTRVVDALVRGEVDAAGLFGTFASDALRQLGPNGRIAPGPGFFAVNFNLVSASASAGVSDADAARLLRAVERANEFIRRNPAEARQVAAGILKIDVKEVERTWDAFEYRLHLSQPLVSQLEAQVRWALREKLVPPGTRAPEYLDMVRVEPLRQVDPRAVRLVR
ncbi:MAG: ABC transporter substrate-binding protein [Burkholderiales bacterium]|nr:ABC transporter substrate-binding protein [Burkholderiales bacterium]